MPIFTRRPSREAGLQKIYTDAYQTSLQSILKESSFEFKDSLEAWKLTLSQITSGMALLDGSPPRTGQEKSLLASIMDIERQCHDRIAALETRLHNMRVDSGQSKGKKIEPSPYRTQVNLSSTHLSTPSTDSQKRVPRVAVGSRASISEPRTEESASRDLGTVGKASPSTTSTTTVLSSHSTSPAASSPVFDFTDRFVSHLPKVKDMPYKLYAKKPTVPPIQHAGPTRSAPVLASEIASTKHKKEAQAIQHRSSLDYPQPAPAQHSHSMLTTLRSKNPLKNRTRGGSHQPAQQSPSPRSSAESIAVTAAKQTTAAAAQAKAESSPLNQFSGFEGTFCSEDQPASPTFNSPQEFQAPAPVEPTQNTASGGPQHEQVQPASSHPRPLPQQPQPNDAQPLISLPGSQPQPPQAPPQHQNASSVSAPQKKAQFHVAYEKVSTRSGRTIFRPRVVRSDAPPAQTVPGSGPSNNQASSQQAKQRPRSNPVLADGKPEESGDLIDLDEVDEWDRTVREKIKNLRGVDKGAAEQIIKEVVLKGDEVNWDDIAGLEKAKASLKETVVYPFLRPDLFMGLREPVLGMLLFGPPGTGKTMLARAVATESKSTFFSISASSLTSKYMGESEKLVRALFQIAKALAPSIIFVDEIDSILTQRADSGEHEASRRIKNEFLVQWSDLQSAAAGKNSDTQAKRVLVLGATNLPWAIDEAARRRFVRRQYIPLPEPFTRRVHLEKLLSRQKHALNEGDLRELVELTDGYSGSDLTALAKDAAMGPLRSLGDALLTTAPDQIRPMGMPDFVESMRSIRPSVSPEGLRAFEQWAEMYGSSGA